MNDMIIKAAQDPSCLLCLTPDRGGSWWSRLRPAMPRDFSEGYRWDALQAAMYSSLPWTSDYHFTFDFTVTDDFENGSYWIMYQSNGRIFFALDKDARGCRFAFGSYSFNGGVFVYAPFASSLAGRHEITLAVEGATLRVTVDGTVYEQSGERVESSAYNRVVTTSAPVTLHTVSLTDDSTGTAVWQAAYSDLYDTSNPWPSPVPRNFAEEPETWYTAAAVSSSKILTHDFYFEIEFISYQKPESNEPVFYNVRTYEPFGVCLRNDGNIIATVTCTRLWEGSGRQYLSLLSGDFNYGEPVRIKVVRQDGVVRIFCNDTEKQTITMPSAPAPVQFTTMPSANFNGTIKCITIFDLTTGKTVWSYPSEAERVRLLTKTNVRTDRGVFEAADDANLAGIATPLDFRGNTTSKTFIARAFCPAHDPASEKLYIHPFFGQGLVSGSSSQYTFQFSLWEDRRAGYNIHIRSVVSAGTTVYEANVRNAEPYLEQWHTYAMVVDYRGDNCYIRTFVDGTMIAERTVSATLIWNTPAATTAQETTVGIRRDPNASYYAGSLTRITAALVFDRALTDAEIAAFGIKRIRNFKEKPMTWTDAMTAANQIGSDDWSFQIKMNVLSQIQQTSGEIFNNDSGSPLKIYGDLIASGSAAFYLRNYVELETWTGKHELQLDVVSGNATLYVDGTLVATKPTGLSTLNFTRASKTSADIEIESVEFRNLTTGETVWQANYNDLFTY